MNYRQGLSPPFSNHLKTDTRNIEVPEALMDRCKARLDARGVVETVATVAAYNMVSRFLVALQVGH